MSCSRGHELMLTGSISGEFNILIHTPQDDWTCLTLLTNMECAHSLHTRLDHVWSSLCLMWEDYVSARKNISTSNHKTAGFLKTSLIFNQVWAPPHPPVVQAVLDCFNAKSAKCKEPLLQLKLTFRLRLNVIFSSQKYTNLFNHCDEPAQTTTEKLEDIIKYRWFLKKLPQVMASDFGRCFITDPKNCCH